jgi:predicted ATP-grasp superfamily ATP-dependent carboligase
MIQHVRPNILIDAVRSSEKRRPTFLGLRPIRRKALGDARTAFGPTGTPVLVFPSRDHGPLGITRSLGRLGVPVYNADFDAFAFSFFSAYSRGKFKLPCSYDAPLKLVEALLACAQVLGQRCVLIPTNDDATLFVAEQAGSLRESFIFPECSPELVRSLCSKKSMYFLARKHQVPTPETSFPQRRGDVIEFIERATFPIMLKAIDGSRLYQRTGRKMFIVRTKSELLETYDRAEDPTAPNLMIQEYIPGGDDVVWMFNGYFDRDSECLLSFTGKKIRQCPIHTGSTSLGICLNNEPVAQITRRFMREVGYRGILDIGYRFDARDGLYKVLDINPRIGATFRLFVGERGMDVARALYCDLTGGSVQRDYAREGRKWIAEDIDFVSSVRYLRERSITLQQWWTSSFGIEECAYLAADDLLPILPMCLSRVAELVRRIYRRFRGTLVARLRADHPAARRTRAGTRWLALRTNSPKRPREAK